MENKSYPRSQKAKKSVVEKLQATSLSSLINKSSNPEANFLYLGRYLDDQFTIERKDLRPSRKHYLQARKKVTQDIKSLNASNDIKKNEYLKSVNNEEILGSVHDIKKLPSAILECSDLSTYAYCQVIMHEKGNLSANSYNNHKKNHHITAANFNKTFQTIKKSKSNLFNSTNINGEHINLLGYFFSTTFESNQFRWIIFLGNNDFFPPGNKDLEILLKEVTKISSHIENIFFHCKYDDKIENVISTLDHLPIPVIIRDIRDSIIYQNISYEDIFDNDLDEYEIETIELEEGNQLCLYLANNETSTTDIYHHYKVNLLGELLNTLKHELSNPLFGLHLSSELMSSQVDDPENKDLIQDISGRAERCQTIIKNFSKLYGDQESSEVNLLNLIKETMTLTKSETRGINKTLQNNIPEERLITQTHPTSLSQIIFNLIINASQAIQTNGSISKHDEIIIECDYNKNKYEISVIDSGPGVPEHLQENIFQSFFTTKKDGTGLGLSICESLVKKMSGEIRYSPRQDKKGSVFTIIFQ